MHVVLLSNELTADATADEADVLQQCAAVGEALATLGHRVSQLTCGLDLGAAKERLLQLQPDVVFNLVEAVGRTDRLMPLPALLMESLGIPFTGAGSWAILTASGKLRSKQLMQAAGLPTPPWIDDTDDSEQHFRTQLEALSVPQQLILKAVWEHASFGMGDDAVVTVGKLESAHIRSLIRDRTQRSGRPHFAEMFVDGREFNLTVLDGPDGPEVMPPAEIRFVDFAPGQPRIVGYRAKWDADSPEYHNTPRTFDFPATDADLLSQLRELALRCWSAFDLRGYARVDFRVDRRSKPWILEVNVNPCLSPDAGFAAALQQGNVLFATAIDRILRSALHP